MVIVVYLHPAILCSASLCFRPYLLLMAGDVEPNPGPLEQAPISHLELNALAEKVPHGYYMKLGLRLGVDEVKLDNLLRDEQRTEKAMYAVLCCWWNDTKECETRKRLVEALSKCGLKVLADKVEKGILCTDSSSTKQDATEEEIEQCRKDLMEELAIAFCQVQTKPLDPDTLLALKDIYTNLILLSEDPKSKSPQPLKYEDILNNKINDFLLRRVLVQGEAGVGKTTFLSKIIDDWIKGTHFQDFKLVLPVRLREVKDGKTIGEIVKSSYLPDNKVTAVQLNNYIRNNPEKVLILLDGYDELTRDLSTEHSILKILECKEYKKCFVIITSRPWKVKHIRDDTELRKRYAFIEIKGFTVENVKEFVSRFFSNDKEPAESLVKFMEKGSLIAENMSPYPIFCAMLCHLWKEEARRKVVQQLQTFSQLFQEIIGFMEDGYLDKQVKQQSNSRSPFSYEDTKMALEENRLKLAEVAFEGLLQNDLVFPEDRFDKEVLQRGYDVGLISRDKKQPGRSERKKPRTTGKVFFPHKLFQEYLAGLHLAAQAKTNPEDYKMLLSLILSKNRDEMKFLLFFAAAQEKQVALDITSGLVNEQEPSSIRSTTGVEATAHKLIVDVVFESLNEDVAREVERSFCSLSRMRELKVDNQMSAHTVAGYFYTFKSLESVVFLKRSYGHTLSSELADKVCTLPTLQRVELKNASFQEVFYMVFEKEAQKSRVKSFTINGTIIEPSTSSGRLARGLCAMLYLDRLILHNATLAEDFYSVMASYAHSAKIKELRLADLSLENEADISKSIARAVCSMPSLKKLILSDWIGLHDAFYTELAANASSTQIEVIELSDFGLKTEKPSCDLAVCLKAMPCLNSLVVVKETKLHSSFFSKSAALSQENGQDENQSAEGKRCFSLTLDNKTAEAWCEHKLVSIMPDLLTFILRCGRTVDTRTLLKASIPGLRELHIQAALPARDPIISDVDSFSRTVMSSFPGLQRLDLTNIALGNQRSKDIIIKLKEHPSIQNISFIKCHTDHGMDAFCRSISVTMEHGERQKM
ncbi:uncharacterized protein LOC762918 isoform X1 [Strongylocentrotus purpuratus]|uniref:Uncharacterized protein n=1 Tax=Strongylocentrotus purpuratus TaxID=7668 RepID=A0A7M7PG77_STRPU|nr:uncharacterized protein LOC762918 isoform X1 [Strongylocentrotus purpuratus]